MRNKTLTRVGLIRPEDLSLEVQDTFNNVGTWKLTLATEHPLTDTLRVPGAGLILTGPQDVLMSGPVTSSEYAATPEDRRGSVVFEGVSDSVILSDMLAWPQPSNPDVTTQTVGHDERTGPAETLMHAYVAANCGPSAPAARRRSALVMGANLGRGPTLSKAARFPTLGELLTEIATVAGLGFRIVQRGTQLTFETFAITDRTREVRLDVLAGTLAGQRVSVSTPGATRVIVAGQGEQEDRTFVPVDNAASVGAEADWGRRIERFVDQRNTDDTAELTQAGNEVLADEGFTGTAVQAVPVADSTMEFGVDWGLGDRVSVIAGGQELTAPVTGMIIKAGSDGFQLGTLLGDPGGFDPNAAAADRAQSTEARVSSLERTAEATPPGARNVSAADYTQTSLPSTYPSGTSRLVLSADQGTAGGWDFGGGSRFGFVTTWRPSNTYATQHWVRLSPTVAEEWVRSGSDAGGWTKWRPLAFEDSRAKGVVAIQQLSTTAYIGDTATVVYTQSFTAEANRCYKVVLRIASVDTDGTGDSTSGRYAKQSATTAVRWAAGNTVTTSSTAVGDIFTTTYNDDSNSSTGLGADFYINNPPAGTVTVGVTLNTRRAAATYGMVRFLPGGLSQLIIEDAGQAL
ncbi:siphovirus ReqiPepy6 Gp37-like family protein [Streptomyces sp. x-19]|uniref:siphovirus ReqiPepy6 Gp37-like family protein n=1 Tax=Streptomyces sp. x-19 TaxID=2789280 RepID=UPI00397F65A5